MKNLFLSGLILCSATCFAQTPDDIVAVSQKVTGLETDFKSLNTNYKKINTNLTSEYKTKYDNSYNNIENALSLMDKIESNYTAINSNIATALSYNLLAQANNPSSTKLGFKFSDVIVNILTEQINAKPDLPPNEKSRFTKIVKGIVDNPIVMSVTKSVPVLGTVTSLISSLSNFCTTKGTPVYRDNNPSKGLASLDITTEQVFTSKEIQNFVTKIQPYVNFYESLNKQSVSFEFNLAKLRTKYRDLQVRIDDIKLQMNKDLNNNTLNNFFKIKESSLPEFDYVKILNSPENINMQSRMYAISNTCAELRKFHNEYQEILKDNFKSNLDLLEEGKKLPGASPDLINQMKDELARLKQSTETAFVKEVEKMSAIQDKIILN